MKEAECGTEAGYVRHQRLNEATCQACRDAHRLGCWRRRARSLEQVKRLLKEAGYQ